jgi:hypothetical protein
LTRVRNNAFRVNRDTAIDDNELGNAFDNANTIDNEYFRLRALAVLSLLRPSSKRRTENAWIPLENFKVENDLLTVTFTLEKKKRKHKKCLACSTKNSSLSTLQEMWTANLRSTRYLHLNKRSRSRHSFFQIR